MNMDQKRSRRDTDSLRSELMETADLDAFLSENADSFHHESVQELLNQLFLKTDLTKAELARRSGVSAVYLHQLFAGRRNPSRDRVLCLAIGLSATLENTQELLRRCGLAELYPKDRRDAIILYGIAHQDSLQEVHDRLFAQDEDTLI